MTVQDLVDKLRQMEPRQSGVRLGDRARNEFNGAFEQWQRMVRAAEQMISLDTKSTDQ